MNDLRYALRQVRRRPALSAAILGTIAVAIAANTAMFSVVHSVLLRPLPFPESDRLATVWLTYPQWRERDVLRQFWDRIPLAHPEYLRLRDGTTTYESVSIYRTDRLALSGPDSPEMVTVGSADGALPTVLRTPMARGRWFDPVEVAAGGPRVTVVSHGFWQARLGGDPAVLERTIDLDGERYAVVGVLPEAFHFTRVSERVTPDVWIPIGVFAWRLNEDNHAFEAVARLQPGATLAQAQDETARLLRGERSPESRGARVVSRKEQEVAAVRPVLHLLWGAAGLILLIACVNVTTLLLGRLTEREPELAVRHALGAGRRRLARHLLAESGVLALLGGLAGTLLAWWGVGALATLLPDNLPRLHEVRIDLPVLAFSAGITLLAVLLVGTLPALLAGARAVHARLREGARHVTAQGRLQRTLVAVQVALALVLLFGAGLLTRTLAELWTVDTGLDRNGVLTFRLSLPGNRYDGDAAREAFYAVLDDRLEALPGVETAASTSVLPFSGASESSSIWPASWGPEEGPKPEVERRLVTPDLHAALAIPVVRGRSLTAADAAPGAERVMLVSERAADDLWPGRNPLGDRVEWNNEWWTVVGITGDVRDRGFDVAPDATVYLPAARASVPARTILVRSTLPAASLAGQVRGVVRDLDPSLPVSDLRTLDEVAASAVATERFRAGLISALAFLALLLAVVGLYGVMHHGVARRVREIGIRMALGAERRRVLRMILGQAGVTVGLGLVAGVALTVPAVRLLDSFLFGVAPFDPPTYAGTIVLMGVVSFLAAWFPARRATRVDPMEALRHE